MNIIWLSEIKWNYLKTRKQQIISRFPKTSSIFFIEPISKRLSNNYFPKKDGHVKTVTIPQLRSISNKLFNQILGYRFIRKVINAIANLWFRLFFHRIMSKTKCIITSNVYWSPLIKTCKIKYPELTIIYDCNDNPLAFPKTPKYKKDYFLETLLLVDKIIIPHLGYKYFIPNKFMKKIDIISNGVDFELFQGSKKNINKMKNIDQPIIIYIGAISEWFDFSLVDYLLTNTTYNYVLIGPSSENIDEKLNQLKKHDNMFYFNAINHQDIPSYLHHADVCIIPFIKNELTESVLPNKLFEYSAVGKPSVITNFNSTLHEFSEYVSVTSNKDEFIDAIKSQVVKPRKPTTLINFARSYDWGAISKQYYDYISNLLKQDIYEH